MIPLIGQQQSLGVEFTITGSPPMLILWVGTNGSRFPLNAATARQIRDGLTAFINDQEALAKPLTGDGSLAAFDTVRRATG